MNLAALRRDLAAANRLLVHEGVLDAFGHVSARHPSDPQRFLLSRYRSPLLVQPDDIIEYGPDSEPVVRTNERLYSERVIHGSIYRERPDVMAVVHHHAPAVMPFAISGVEIVPVFHMGSVIAPRVPFWDSRNEFGDTSLLVTTHEQGRSLARALGPHWMVLMRRHGATMAGRTLEEVVFRTVYSCQNAEYQLRAHGLGGIQPLSPGEAEKASETLLQPGPLGRAWEYWLARLAKREGVAKARQR